MPNTRTLLAKEYWSQASNAPLQYQVPRHHDSSASQSQCQVVASVDLSTKPLLRIDACYLARAGSSSGIGKAVALAFATQNSDDGKEMTKICVMSRSKARLQKVVQEIETLGAQGFAVAGDLTQASDCHIAVQEAVSRVSCMLAKQRSSHCRLV